MPPPRLNTGSGDGGGTIDFQTWGTRTSAAASASGVPPSPARKSTSKAPPASPPPAKGCCCWPASASARRVAAGGAGGSPTSAAAQKRLESTEYRARVHSHALQLRAQARAVLLVQKLVRRHLAKKRARAAAEQRARRPVQTRTLNS